MKTQDFPSPVFPFACGNAECSQKYDLSDFSDIFMLWGFIYLAEGQSRLIGITCPECLKTTIRRYHLHTPDFSLSIVKSHPNTIGEVRFFVPFSAGILSKAGIAPCPPASTENDCEYSMPEGLRPAIPYPELISQEFPYAINEHVVSTLLRIENEVGYKAFPRIYPEYNVYQKFDQFLLEEDAEEIPGEIIKGIHDAFSTIVEAEAMPVLGMPSVEPRRFQPGHSKVVDSERYLELDISENAWLTDRFRCHIADFVAEYRVVRNKIDFDRTYRDEFIDKYIDLFYKVGGLKKQRKLQQKIELMESESGEEMATAPDPEYQLQYSPSPAKEKTKRPQYAIFKEGNRWTIFFASKPYRGLKQKGFAYIQELLVNKNKVYETNSLSNVLPINQRSKPAKDDNLISRNEHKAEILDERAQTEYKNELNRLREALDDASNNSDPLIQKLAKKELEEFQKEYDKAIGLGGKVRNFRDESERLQGAISKSIERAINETKEHDKALFQHFRAAIKPRNSPKICYRPDADIEWDVSAPANQD